MDEAEQINYVKDQLMNEIHVSIAWEGYYDNQEKMKHIQADIDCGLSFPFKIIYDALLSKKSGIIHSSLHGLYKEAKALDDEIRNESLEIYFKAQNQGQQVNKIDDRYFKMTAKGISHRLGENRLLVAPHLWLPVMFK